MLFRMFKYTVKERIRRQMVSDIMGHPVPITLYHPDICQFFPKLPYLTLHYETHSPNPEQPHQTLLYPVFIVHQY